MREINIRNIIWDTDEISIDDYDLPEEVAIDEDIDEEDIANYLFDIYGWCVSSFSIEYDSRESLELRKAITNFCHWKINRNMCDDGDCEFCPVNKAYDMARSYELNIKPKKPDFTNHTGGDYPN